jgi:hypothetical protein
MRKEDRGGRIGFPTALLGGAFILAGACSDSRTVSTVEPIRTVDDSFRPILELPRFPEGSGPVVCIDEAHNNFHTAEGTYGPFAEVLRRDGFVVRRATDPSNEPTLAECGILVIADAQPPARAGDPPTFPEQEVHLLNEWVRGGGALFIITDHMPDPDPIRELAASFGIEVSDGYVLNGAPAGPERPLVFRLDDGTLAVDPLTGSLGGEAAIQQVATFTGSAFRSVAMPFRPLLVFGPGRESWMPEEYWVFNDATPRVDVEGWFQGGILEWGEGRLAFFSEAAMFTAQVFEEGRVRAGMNAPEAVDNLRLLRRVMGWLSGSEG